MKVLVACELSGVVRDAFLRLGHEAMSCDLLPAEKPGPHYQGDVRDILGNGYDLMIAHPPCTYLCSSGLHWNKRRPGREMETQKALDFVRMLLDAPIPRIAVENPVGCISTQIRKYDQKIQPWQFGHDASKGTCLWLKNLPLLKHQKIIPPKGYKLVKFAMELPVCDCCGEEALCPDCKMHFGECSCIGPTQDGITYRKIDGYLFGTDRHPAPRPVWDNQTPTGQNKIGPSDDRWLKRSRTYTGIADAMAEQWAGAA